VVEKKEKQVLQEVQQEVIAQLPKVRAEKKKKQALAEKAPEKPMVDLQVGDRVRMFDGKAIGSIDAIEKNKATVNYGVFTTKVNLDQLEFVSRKK
ncbi:MAG TPA: DNA mismatch repair protein MutS, partial [Flavobacteriaceae bacterium]|nr:DNA mismatch repair protein MutS [Flavobacteriaceae bacterium]